VLSFDRKAPTTGRMIVRRSASTLIAPVVNRTLARSVLLDRNAGNPTLRPWRFPARESDQFLSAAHRSAIPVAYASLEFSAHHGATTAFSAFHRLRSAYRFHGTGTWPGSAWRASRSAFTWPSAQLYALRLAPN
jgi:hypothetical protein